MKTILPSSSSAFLKDVRIKMDVLAFGNGVFAARQPARVLFDGVVNLPDVLINGTTGASWTSRYPYKGGVTNINIFYSAGDSKWYLIDLTLNKAFSATTVNDPWVESTGISNMDDFVALKQHGASYYPEPTATGSLAGMASVTYAGSNIWYGTTNKPGGSGPTQNILKFTAKNTYTTVTVPSGLQGSLNSTTHPGKVYFVNSLLFYVGVGADSTTSVIYTSTDAVTWTLATFDVTPSSPWFGAVYRYGSNYGIVSDVGVGKSSSPRVWTSGAGSSWVTNSFTLGTAYPDDFLVVGSNRILANNNGWPNPKQGVLSSTDFVNWTPYNQYRIPLPFIGKLLTFVNPKTSGVTGRAQVTYRGLTMTEPFALNSYTSWSALSTYLAGKVNAFFGGKVVGSQVGDGFKSTAELGNEILSKISWDGVPTVSNRTTIKPSPVLAKTVDINISRSNLDGGAYDIGSGVVYYVVINGVEYSYTPTSIAPDNYYQAMIAYSPRYYWRFRYDNAADRPAVPYAYGFASVGSITGAMVSPGAGAGFGPTRSLINDGEDCVNWSISSASQDPGWRVYYAGGYPATTLNNDGNCIKGTTNFTISMWMKATGPNSANPTNKWLAGSTTLFSQVMLNGGFEYQIMISHSNITGKIIFQIAKGNDIGQQGLSFYTGHHVEADVPTLPNGTPFHLVFTRGGNDKLCIYVNGVLAASAQWETSYSVESTYSYVRGLGVSYNALAMDELAIFYSELSAGVITSHYAAATAANDANAKPYFTPVYNGLGALISALPGYSVAYTSQNYSDWDSTQVKTKMTITGPVSVDYDIYSYSTKGPKFTVVESL